MRYFFIFLINILLSICDSCFQSIEFVEVVLNFNIHDNVRYHIEYFKTNV